jgi:hypothetical protein
LLGYFILVSQGPDVIIGSSAWQASQTQRLCRREICYSSTLEYLLRLKIAQMG